jgi:hypothetical protein
MVTEIRSLFLNIQFFFFNFFSLATKFWSPGYDWGVDKSTEFFWPFDMAIQIKLLVLTIQFLFTGD